MNTDMLLSALIVGVVATALLDAWAWLLKSTLQVPSLRLCVLGRWLLQMPEQGMVQCHVVQQPGHRGECALGWSVHYAIGILFTLGYFLMLQWLQRPPSLMIAIAYALATVVFAFFVMQPGMGAGLAARHTLKPWRARGKSMLSHGIFGVGLHIGSLIVSN